MLGRVTSRSLPSGSLHTTVRKMPCWPGLYEYPWESTRTWPWRHTHAAPGWMTGG